MYRNLDEYKQDRNAIVEELRLAGAKIEHKNTFCCPFHADHTASANIFQSDTKDWLFKCFVCDGKPMSAIDLNANRTNREPADVIREILGMNEKHQKREPEKPAKKFASVEEMRKDLEINWKVESVYEYPHPETGFLDLIVFRILPKDGNGGKQFRQAHQEGDRFVFGGTSPNPLYHRKELLDAQIVVVTEGEKCVMAIEYILKGNGMIAATTSPGGYSSPDKADWSPLSGKRVVIWRDNDEYGEKHEASVVACLNALKVPPQSVAKVDVTKLNLPPKGDVCEFFHACSKETRVSAFMDVIDSAVSDSPAQGVLDRIRLIHAGEWATVPFPYEPSLTMATRALLPGTITILCGNPGATKSLFVFHCLTDWFSHGLPIAAFLLEENLTHHLFRFLAIRSRNSNLLNDEWITEHGDQVDEEYAKHKKFLDGIGKRLTVLTDTHPNLKDILEWIEKMGAAGNRVLVVDPISLAKKGREPWNEDAEFTLKALQSAQRHGFSLILVTHPTKKRVAGSMALSELSGGAAYERVSQCVLWVETYYPDKSVVVDDIVESRQCEINRGISILKARNGPCGGREIGFHFDGAAFDFKEEGLIRSENKKREKT